MADTSNIAVDHSFRAPGWLARHPLVVLACILVGGGIFALLAYQLKTNGPLMAWDITLYERFQAMAARAPAGFLEIMTFGFFLGKEVVELIGLILVIYFLHKRFWPELGMVLIGWSGGALMWIFITHYFQRARPPHQLGIPVLNEFSFPSGHTMQTILSFGLLAYFLIPHMPSRGWKWLIAIAAVLTMLFIGFCRLYEGGHYLTDLIAGYALGVAWGALVYSVMELFVLRRRV